MTPVRSFLILPILVLLILLTAGCLSDQDTMSDTPGQGKEPVPASYRAAISQPDARSDYIRMDTDIYNAGEVIEFVVTNDGLLPLACSTTPPEFRVIFQTGTGRWATKMGPEEPASGTPSYLGRNESTKMYGFISSGWEAGRYRIVSDCGPERDFLIRVLPAPVVPAAEPEPEYEPELAATPCPVTAENPAGPWIRIDPIGDQVAARPFTISGTTNLLAGEELYYTIFSPAEGEDAAGLDPRGSFVTVVEAGSCGTNTWTAMGEIQATGEFFIGITDTGRQVTAIQRFGVYLS